MFFCQGPDSLESLFRDDFRGLQLWVGRSLLSEVFLNELVVGFMVLFLFNEKRLEFFYSCFIGEKGEIELSLDVLGRLWTTLRGRGRKRRWRKFGRILGNTRFRSFFEFWKFFMLLYCMLRVLLRFLIAIIIVSYTFHHWTLAKFKNGIPLRHYLLVLGTFDIHRIVWRVLILHANFFLN